ncbi:hypothetical protein HanXRQr2_Chr13g0590371 [Helianthus annuus]|uniref:Uncharacterized protein n=1 Tax=Helianthus annuus TaxID=4232 RepID=A0A9K3EKC2_HELAN|nr:hypothetical protein HanXRQr2_Chr13g0590371 [Helianthus annuus]KAJ0849422.1 hypothetical protein HanPSC8_Chr13g0568571 [Helianthus annuus]
MGLDSKAGVSRGSKQKMRRFNCTGEDCRKTSGTENETFQHLWTRGFRWMADEETS